MALANRQEQRDYQRTWLRRRRAEWFAEHGPCVQCGSNEELCLDRIDKSQPRPMGIWSWKVERRDQELKNCRVLCMKCLNEERRVVCGKSGHLNGAAVLTEEQVRFIREHARMPMSLLTKITRVHRQTVRDVLTGHTWKNV